MLLIGNCGMNGWMNGRMDVVCVSVCSIILHIGRSEAENQCLPLTV